MGLEHLLPVLCFDLGSGSSSYHDIDLDRPLFDLVILLGFPLSN